MSAFLFYKPFFIGGIPLRQISLLFTIPTIYIFKLCVPIHLHTDSLFFSILYGRRKLFYAVVFVIFAIKKSHNEQAPSQKRMDIGLSRRYKTEAFWAEAPVLLCKNEFLGV